MESPATYSTREIDELQRDDAADDCKLCEVPEIGPGSEDQSRGQRECVLGKKSGSMMLGVEAVNLDKILFKRTSPRWNQGAVEGQADHQ